MSSQNLSVFGYVFSFISAFADAFVVAYEAPEAAAFRARNRECLVEVAMVAAAIGYEAIDSLVNFLVARAAKDTAVMIEAGRTSYYTSSTFASVEQGYTLWLEIGEANFKAAETVMVYTAVASAFVLTLVRVWAEEQVESCLAKEEVEIAASKEQQLSIEGFVPFALLSPVAEVEVVVEPVAPTFSIHHAKAVVKNLGKMNQVKSILGTSSSSWANLASDLILFATEGGYSTLEEAASALKGAKASV